MNLRISPATLLLIAGTLLIPTFGAAQTSPAELDKSLDMLVGDHVKVQHLLANLQQSVSQHDPVAVAALVHYPLRVNPGNHPFTVKSPKAFIKDYDRIVTPDIAAAIQKQKYETLFVNSQGAMLGDGEVWITSFCLDKACKQSDIKVGTIQDAMKLKP
jgi:hypothetical protein